MNGNRFAAFFAILAAALYALSAPLSKLFLQNVAPTVMASLLYLGAGLGMMLLSLARRVLGHPSTEARLTRKDLPFTLGMIALDILAPILLMLGLERSTAANVSLLNSFEIVATSLIALLIFRERISGRLWAAIGLITLSTVLLSLEDAESLRFSVGSIFVLLACCCWGLENNCTRMLSYSDPQQIVVIKGLCSGGVSLGEVLLADEENLPAVLKAWMTEHPGENSLDVAPHEKRRMELIDPLSEGCSIETCEMVCVLNWPRVLQALLHLKALYQPLEDGEACLRVDGQTFESRVRDGRAEVFTTNCTPELELEHLEAERLFFSLSGLCVLPDRRLCNWAPLPYYINRADKF